MGEPDGYFTSIPGANDYPSSTSRQPSYQGGPANGQTQPPPSLPSHAHQPTASTSAPPPSEQVPPAARRAQKRPAKTVDSPPPEIDESLLPSDPKARRRERNRLAASAFRSRKKEKLETLETRLGLLEEENNGLKDEVDRLRSVLTDLGAVAAMSGLVDDKGAEVRLDERLIQGPSRVHGRGGEYDGLDDEEREWDERIGQRSGGPATRSDGGRSGSTIGDGGRDDVDELEEEEAARPSRAKAKSGKGKIKAKTKAKASTTTAPPAPSAPAPGAMAPTPAPPSPDRSSSLQSMDYSSYQDELEHAAEPSHPQGRYEEQHQNGHNPIYAVPAPPSGPAVAPPPAPASSHHASSDPSPSSRSAMPPQQSLHLRRMPSNSHLRNSIAVNSPSEGSGSDTTPGNDFNPTQPPNTLASLQMPPLPTTGFTLPPLPLTPSTAAAFGGLNTPSRFLIGGGSPFIPGSPFGHPHASAAGAMLGFTGVAVSDVRSTPSPGLEKSGFSWGAR